MKEITIDVAIIGGGPAGMAAALSINEQGIIPLILERNYELGGILHQCIHNGFGLHRFKEELTGPEYAQRYINEIKEKKIEIKLNTMVLEIRKDKEIYAINPTEGLIKIKAKAIILAMGCRERTRTAVRIPGYRPSGVLTAGLAQRLVNMEGIFPGKEIVILGSGDIGMIMARRMTLEGAKVKAIVEIQPFINGLNRNRVQCLLDFNIPLLLSHTITNIYGKDRIEAVSISKVDDSWNPIEGTETKIFCDTLLLSVGLIPENELSRKIGVVINSQTGGPNVNENLETNINGIFACGNVLQVHDIVDWVSEEGHKAGKMASAYIKKEIQKSQNVVLTKPGKNVAFIVPQNINESALKEEIELHFRVKKPLDNVVIILSSKKGPFFQRKQKYVRPGEMIRLKIKNLLQNEIFDWIQIDINQLKEGL